MKNKIGEKTSHSYWSWTHGPRGLLTTHTGSMVVEKLPEVNPPSERVPEEVFW